MCGALGVTPPRQGSGHATALSARAGVISPLVRGTALLLLPAEEELGGPPEHPQSTPTPGTPVASLAARRVGACEHRVS